MAGTQHPRERDELVVLLNSRPEWRKLRDYGLALYTAGLPVALCFWMVYIEDAQNIEAKDDRAPTYRFGVLLNHCMRVSAIDQDVLGRLPNRWFDKAVP
jgi:uncharacterized protein YlbG (UPF0298 family)